MNCPTCGASVMLGSAQCQKCGASMLGGAAPPPPRVRPVNDLSSLRDLSRVEPGGPPDPPHIHPVEPGSGFVGPPPPLPPGVGTAPPPPPVTDRRHAPRQGRVIQVGPAPSRRARGCGCLVPLIVLAVVGGVGFSIYNAVSASLDGFGDFGNLFRGPEPRDAGELALGVRIEGDLDGDNFDDYSFTGTGESVVVVVQGDGDALLEVFEGDDDDPVARDDDSGPGSRQPILRFEAEEGEEYRVRVRPFSSSTDVEDYTLVAVPDSSLSGRVERGTRRLGALLSGEQARYEVLGGGGPLTIEVQAIGDADPRVEVVAADGTSMGSDDDGGDDLHSSRLVVDLPEGQVFTIVVEGFGSRAVVYELSLR